MIFWSVFFAIVFAFLALRAGIVMWKRLTDYTWEEIIRKILWGGIIATGAVAILALFVVAAHS